MTFDVYRTYNRIHNRIKSAYVRVSLRLQRLFNG